MAKIGIRLPQPHETSFDFALDCATLADDTGIDTIWIGESWHQNSVPLITRALAETTTLDVCSGIFNIYSRTPALIAMTAALLSNQSNGRFRLGLGTSGPQVIEHFHGHQFTTPISRTEEYIEIINAFLTGDTVTYTGDHFSLDGFALDNPPATSTPIYNAAMGQNNLHLTGKRADGWIPLFIPTTGLQSTMEPIQQGATDANRSITDITIAPWIPTCISETRPEAARTNARNLLAFYISAMGDFYANTVTRYGYGDTVDAIRTAWNSGGLTDAQAQVTDDLLIEFTACGTPTEAQAALDEYRANGADMPVAYIPAYWADNDIITETITTLT